MFSRSTQRSRSHARTIAFSIFVLATAAVIVGGDVISDASEPTRDTRYNDPSADAADAFDASAVEVEDEGVILGPSFKLLATRKFIESQIGPYLLSRDSIPIAGGKFSMVRGGRRAPHIRIPDTLSNGDGDDVDTSTDINGVAFADDDDDTLPESPRLRKMELIRRSKPKVMEIDEIDDEDDEIDGVIGPSVIAKADGLSLKFEKMATPVVRIARSKSTGLASMRLTIPEFTVRVSTSKYLLRAGIIGARCRGENIDLRVRGSMKGSFKINFIPAGDAGDERETFTTEVPTIVVTARGAKVSFDILGSTCPAINSAGDLISSMGFGEDKIAEAAANAITEMIMSTTMDGHEIGIPVPNPHGRPISATVSLDYTSMTMESIEGDTAIALTTRPNIVLLGGEVGKIAPDNFPYDLDPSVSWVDMSRDEWFPHADSSTKKSDAENNDDHHAKEANNDDADGAKKAVGATFAASTNIASVTKTLSSVFRQIGLVSIQDGTTAIAAQITSIDALCDAHDTFALSGVVSFNGTAGGHHVRGSIHRKFMISLGSRGVFSLKSVDSDTNNEKESKEGTMDATTAFYDQVRWVNDKNMGDNDNNNSDKSHRREAAIVMETMLSRLGWIGVNLPKILHASVLDGDEGEGDAQYGFIPSLHCTPQGREDVTFAIKLA